MLEFAIKNKRVVLIQNRRNFIKLHSQNSNHCGIIVCTDDRNLERLSYRINQAISNEETLINKLVRVNRPQE